MLRIGMLVTALSVVATGCLATDEDTVGEKDFELTSVTWTNVVGVDAVGDDLTKSTGTTGWNAGAVSNETISTDGAVEFTTGEINRAKTVGLSNGDTDQNYTDIDFAIRLTNTGRMRVFEAGVDRGPFGPYAAGDIFRVDVDGGVVTYLRNGSVFYTSTLSPTFPLLVDTSLSEVGATVQDVMLGEEYFQNAVGVSTSGDDITKTSTTAGFNAGASSVASIAGNGHVEFTTAEANRGKMGGLNNGDASQSVADIDFAISLSAVGVVRVYESGTSRGQFGTYVAGDVFRVTVNNGVVTYARNGTVFYTSAVAPTSPLRFDSTFNQTGGTIQNVTLSENFWQNAVNVDTDGNDLVKVSGGTGWNGGASTTSSITGDGFAEFTTGENSKAKMAGLSNGDASQNYTEIDFAINLSTTGIVKVYENGVLRFTSGGYVAGDVFRIAVAAGVVTYAQNSTVFYTSSATPTDPLLFDTALNHVGATIQNVVVSD